MQKAIQGKLSWIGLHGMLRERVGISIHNFSTARNKQTQEYLYVGETLNFVVERVGVTLEH